MAGEAVGGRLTWLCLAASKLKSACIWFHHGVAVILKGVLLGKSALR